MNATAVAPVKFVPLIVTLAPASPLVGVKPVIVGGNRTVKLVALVAVPPAVVTLSGGVSCWTPGSDQSVPDLLQRADDALFEAKSAGRNRTCVARAEGDDEFADLEVALSQIALGD